MCAGLSERSIQNTVLVHVDMHYPKPYARNPISLVEDVIHLLPSLPEIRTPIFHSWLVAELMATPVYSCSSAAASCALRSEFTVKEYCITWSEALASERATACCYCSSIRSVGCRFGGKSAVA